MRQRAVDAGADDGRMDVRGKACESQDISICVFEKIGSPGRMATPRIRTGLAKFWPFGIRALSATVLPKSWAATGGASSCQCASIFQERGPRPGIDGAIRLKRVLAFASSLRALGVVGVLAVPGCTLEILPKIDVGEQEGSAQEAREIRKRLVHMLAVALDLKIQTGRMTDLDWQRETLLEILIRIFCDKLTEAVRRGMPRRYTRREDDLPTLRGSLDIPRQFTRHLANPGRLACRYDELSEDIALSRIMKATIVQLAGMSRNATNVQRLRELAFVHAEVAEVQVPALRWDDVVIDRTNKAWQELFGMAQLFLRNRYQTTSAGSGQGSALLFEMNALFEEYIGRLVTRALAGSEFRVTLQGGRLFCLTSLDEGRAMFQTRPDILIWRAGQVAHVIDTKWKRISNRIDDPKQGVSQADVYQMMAYAHLYKAPRLTLLYPHHAGLGGEDGIRARFRVTGQETVLETASFDISSGADLVDRIRGRILTGFEEMSPALR